ncbi:MAG: DUF6465 family protein [Eubacteriales bacterium]|nr:DUF6465 family protein [Eubacteriales bacterium]
MARPRKAETTAKAAAPAETVKAAAEKTVEAATAEAVTAEATPAEEKAAPAKAAAKKTTTRKTAAKPAAKKTAPKKAACKTSVCVEMNGLSVSVDAIQDAVKKAVKDQGLDASDLKIYINAAEQAAYYTVDGVGGESSKVDLNSL